MILRRDDPEFHTWWMENYTYTSEEAAYLPAEFVQEDGVFDVAAWERWVEERKEEYEHSKPNI
jgi:hypothetical protein